MVTKSFWLMSYTKRRLHGDDRIFSGFLGKQFWFYGFKLLEDHSQLHNVHVYFVAITVTVSSSVEVGIFPHMEKCLAEIHHWLISNKQKLSGDKTELILLVAEHLRTLVQQLRPSLRVGDAVVSPHWLCEGSGDPAGLPAVHASLYQPDHS